ncbi:pentatricopeptide repeat-containing protein At4g21065-like [Euphorbia lathyris]|uniref:pentatricopeptide repeat-containing protein At4g21065-like n=1 Tax=Euphorbia lathyris TaxID=212925 RepID=UPI003314349C
MIMSFRYLTSRLNSNLQTFLFLKAKDKLPFLQLGFSSSKFYQLFLSSGLASSKHNSLSKEETLMSMLKKCSTMKELKQIHACIIRAGFQQNLFVVGKVIVFCAVSELGDLNYAVSVFEDIENPDGFLWNTMIRGFGKTKNPQKAFEVFNRMREKGLVADNFTFSFLVKVCEQLGSIFLGEQMHCSALKHGLDSHVFVRNSLIHMYGMFKKVETSRQLFDEIPEPELVAWNSIICCCLYCDKCEDALDLFSRMLRHGIEPDEATLVVIFAACSGLGALDFGRWIHSCISSTNLSSILEVNNALIDMYAKCGALEEAYETFHRMKNRNIVTWNTMISGLATHGHTDKALELFSEMLEDKALVPDGITFLGVLCACNHGGMVDQGRRFFDMMSEEYCIQPTIKHYGSMVDILGRAGFLEEAYGLIRSMPMECNDIVWRTLLAACRLHGNVELGEKVRSHLLVLKPDHSSDYVLIANMYASMGQWAEVMRVRKSMHTRGVQKPQPGNSLIDSASSMNRDQVSV